MNPFKLISSLNHDLRSPICTVNNLLYLLRREMTDSSQLGMLEGIEAANDEIQDLLNNLLDFSKLQSGGLKPCMESFTLSDLICELRPKFKHQTQSKNILLSYMHPNDALMELYGNKSQIVKTLHHILGLIISISHYSQISLDTEIKQSIHDKMLYFKVLFQGSTEDNTKLIEYFTQPDNSLIPSIPDSDMELRLCLYDAFIKSLNGEITTCVFDPQTTHFIISIPLNSDNQ